MLYLPRKIKKVIFTLRLSLFAIFVLLFILIIFTLASIFYFHFSKAVINNAILMMDKAAYNVAIELDDQLLPSEAASQFSVNNIRDGILNIRDINIMFPYMVHLLNKLPLTDGLFWGDSVGNFLYVRKREGQGFLAEYINRSVMPATTILYFLDEHHRILKEIPMQTGYDPRNATWYHLATSMKKTTWSPTYLYLSVKHFLGTTVTTPAYNSNNQLIGVFGIDIILDDLSRYIAQQKIKKTGKVFIISKEGQVVAGANVITPVNSKKLLDIHQTGNQPLATAFDIYLKYHKNTFQFRSGKTNYLASFKTIPILSNNGWMIAVIDKTIDFTGNLYRIELFYVLVTILSFLFGLLLMSKLVSRVVSPIKELVKEAEKIKNFNLESHLRINSRIKEIIELSDAIFGMKLGLRSFQRYVPADLVRQLISSDADLRGKGTKTYLALFFSDIKDFTTITEKEDTTKLVKQICDYFEIITHNIVACNGTIDKYIGDSTMAFWGAPFPVNSPCVKAAKTALDCLSDLKIANASWEETGKPQLLTRIAMHYGEAIVGSLGSTDRLTYTAIGDSVNLTNRLININKFYGTAIIVTHSFYDQIKDKFVLRFIDHIKVKGKVECITIYELLAETKEEVPFDIEQYCQQYQCAFKAYQQQDWQKAIALFEKCLLIFPDDSLSLTFIQRCNVFIIHPPGEWQGVWNFTQK